MGISGNACEASIGLSFCVFGSSARAPDLNLEFGFDSLLDSSASEVQAPWVGVIFRLNSRVASLNSRVKQNLVGRTADILRSMCMV